MSTVHMNFELLRPRQPRSYKVFPLADDGTIEGPAIPLRAETDEEALREARHCCGDPSEVWNGLRRVTRMRRRA